MTPPPRTEVAVVLERVAAPNAWEAWSFRLVEVVPDEGVFGTTPRRLVDDGRVSRWLFPGYAVELRADECKGYFLNLTSGRPSWFVSWMREGDAELPTVTAVSVSYVEADRRMASDERVETLPLAPELCDWLQRFTNEHFRPDSARKVRAMSFLSPEERARAAPATPMSAQALREMFHTDPHFRQPDGLDVADTEVHAVEGTPAGRQRQIEKARRLGLLDDELKDQPPPA